MLFRSNLDCFIQNSHLFFISIYSYFLPHIGVLELFCIKQSKLFLKPQNPFSPHAISYQNPSPFLPHRSGSKDLSVLLTQAAIPSPFLPHRSGSKDLSVLLTQAAIEVRVWVRTGSMSSHS